MSGLAASGRQHPDADVVADISNASKHNVLIQNRSYTPLQSSANVVVQMTHCGALTSGPLGAAPIGATASRVIVQIGNQHYDVVGCVSDLYSLWDRLMHENSW